MIQSKRHGLIRLMNAFIMTWQMNRKAGFCTYVKGKEKILHVPYGFIPSLRLFHSYNGGQSNEGGRKLCRTRDKPSIFWRLLQTTYNYTFEACLGVFSVRFWWYNITAAYLPLKQWDLSMRSAIKALEPYPTTRMMRSVCGCFDPFLGVILLKT